MPRGEANGEPPAVNAPRKRMSLRGGVAFLYHRAGLNRWYPAMEGRHSQGRDQKYLELAAAGVTLKGETLDKRLYVPEPFRVADKEEIGERRRRKLAMLLSPGDDVAYKMAIVIGQFNGAEQSAYGRRLLVKAHAGRAAVHGEQGLGARRARLCGHPWQARDADLERKPMVVMAALIYAKREHLYQVDSLSMTLVSDQWIPLDGLHELPLVEELQRQGRAFLKPLRFDAKSGACFPNALLLDTEGGPFPLHVVSAFLDPKEQAPRRRRFRPRVTTRGCGAPTRPCLRCRRVRVPGQPLQGLTRREGSASPSRIAMVSRGARAPAAKAPDEASSGGNARPPGSAATRDRLALGLCERLLSSDA